MSLSVFVIDTSYLLELFAVPGFSDDFSVKEVRNRFKEAIENKSRLYVPLPCIFELANHIADVKDGNLRTVLGKKFYETIESCISENTPWNITPSCSMEHLLQLCEVFTERYAPQGIGLTDTSTIQESERLKGKYRTFNYSVHIWTKDKNLKSHEPDTEINPFLS